MSNTDLGARFIGFYFHKHIRLRFYFPSQTSKSQLLSQSLLSHRNRALLNPQSIGISIWIAGFAGLSSALESLSISRQVYQVCGFAQSQLESLGLLSSSESESLGLLQSEFYTTSLNRWVCFVGSLNCSRNCFVRGVCYQTRVLHKIPGMCLFIFWRFELFLDIIWHDFGVLFWFFICTCYWFFSGTDFELYWFWHDCFIRSCTDYLTWCGGF